MITRIIFLLPIILCLISCGEGHNGYNFVHLSYGVHRFLYVFNQSDYHLCYGSEIEACQKKYSISDFLESKSCDPKKQSCEFHYYYRYTFSPDDEFAIYTTYDDDLRTIIVTGGKDDIILYMTDYSTSSTYILKEPITVTQQTGFCDISVLNILFFQSLRSKYNISLDYNSMTMNPDVCRLAQLLACVSMYYPLGIDIDSNILPEDIFRAGLGCFIMIYSRYNSDLEQVLDMK
ncbi:MAG: hypothetical protein N3B13_03005 [Deltaproteobacteria bacterium]|nr:hypothetical protein [Deltaproteobacteria bacterium]